MSAILDSRWAYETLLCGNNRKQAPAASRRMPIIVVCTKCRKSFKVSEKFAGHTGACPNCKAPIKVPEKGQEVKVHAPEEFEGGGRSTTGKLVTKPIVRTNAKFQPVTFAIIAAVAVVGLALTWIGGQNQLFDGMVVTAAGLLLISPLLAIAAYEMLRDDEYEPYRGLQLFIRAAICGTAYTALWGAFALLASRGLITGELWNWVLVLPPLVAAGGLAAMGAFDLEFGNGMFHYGFYLLVSLILRWVAGMTWIWDI